jgi:outer membrane biosynthesis protein TonB
VFRRAEAKLKSLLPGLSITTNASKPRKGTFEVVAGDVVVVSLIAMPRPFKKLRDLEMEEVADKVKEALAGGKGKGAKPAKSQKAEKKSAAAQKKKAPAKKKSASTKKKSASTKKKPAPTKKRSSTAKGKASKKAAVGTRRSKRQKTKN